MNSHLRTFPHRLFGGWLAAAAVCAASLAPSASAQSLYGEQLTLDVSPRSAPGYFHPAHTDDAVWRDTGEVPPSAPAEREVWQLPRIVPEPVYDPRGDWTLQVLPDGLIYRSYLAGVREPRMASVWNHDRRLGWIWDIALGGRAGILRWGTDDDAHPDGWQLDIEGAGLPRLDIEGGERDLVAVDFRFGVPITYGWGAYQTKFAYYHLSSHLGDEYMLNTPGYRRINFARDVLVWGHSYYVTPALRLYGEVGWAFFCDVSEPWEFQFGIDYSPPEPSGLHGAPFFALNGHLREENDFGGNFVAQAGWQWRGGNGSHLFRLGVQYFNGYSEQYEFFDKTEQKIGVGLWYDF